jgi:membrane protease YdiL (CAAX protease family)
MNKYIALIISSLLFMLAHAPNNYTATLPLFNIFLAGLLLGSVYIYTKNLWYSISLHFFWNFLQGPVLGYSVSGTDIHSSIIRIKHSANTLLNGGNFGFEGSILCSVFMILFVLLTIWIMNNKAQNKELNSKVNTSVTEQMNE